MYNQYYISAQVAFVHSADNFIYTYNKSDTVHSS